MKDSWQTYYRSRLMTAEVAAAKITDGARVNIPLFGATTVPKALWARRDSLRGVELCMSSPPSDPGWFRGEPSEAFDLEMEVFIGDIARDAHYEGRAPYLPNLMSYKFKAHDEERAEVQDADVAIVLCSTPNEAGYVHFGLQHWFKRSLVERTRFCIAEIDPTLFKACGDVFVHVSEFDCFVENSPVDIRPDLVEAEIAKAEPDRQATMRQLISEMSDEQRRAVLRVVPFIEPDDLRRRMRLHAPSAEDEAIARHLEPLIRDGDCIQIGTGDPSSQMIKLGVFDKKRDLGVHTEMVAPGIGRLWRDGVVTGKRKNQYAEKVIGTSWAGADREDLEIMSDNPAFELHDSSWVLHVPRIAANDRQVSMNNGISIDLTGQITCETIVGGMMLNGTGGQPENHLGAFMSKGGRAITLLRSTAMSGAISRVVAEHEPGTMVTIPRFFADTVISEFGVARLLGLNHRKRADALIAIAHPDHRDGLRKAARQKFGV